MGTLQSELKRAGRKSTDGKLEQAARDAFKAAPRNKDHAVRQFVLRCEQPMWLHLCDTNEQFRRLLLDIMRGLIGEASDDRPAPDNRTTRVIAGQQSADGDQTACDNQSITVPSAAGARSQASCGDQLIHAPGATNFADGDQMSDDNQSLVVPSASAAGDQLCNDDQAEHVASGAPTPARAARGDQQPHDDHVKRVPSRSSSGAVDVSRPRPTFAEQNSGIGIIAAAAAVRASGRSGIAVDKRVFGKRLYEATSSDCEKAALLEEAEREFFSYLSIRVPPGLTVGDCFSDAELNKLFAQYKEKVRTHAV
jgi:hypothetical protein